MQSAHLNPHQPRPSLFSKTLNRIFGFIVFILGSAILSVVIEWLGMYFQWHERPNHAESIFRLEYAYLSDSIQRLSSQFTLDYLLKGLSWLIQGVKSLMDSFYAFEVQFSQLVDLRVIDQIITQTHPYLQSMQWVLLTVLVRASILVLSTPLFILAIIVGLVDGLVERELRKWGGGRESSNQFKIARALIWPLYLTAWVLYLSYPGHINHLWVVIPCAAMLAYFVRHTFFKMKKYF